MHVRVGQSNGFIGRVYTKKSHLENFCKIFRAYLYVESIFLRPLTNFQKFGNLIFPKIIFSVQFCKIH